jgi:sterol 3beta-glucosyltransferase
MDNMSLSSGSTALEKESVVVSTPGDMTPQSDDPEWLSSLTSPANTINSDATLFSQRTLSASPPPCDQKTDYDECKNAVTAKLAPLSHSIEFVRSHEVPIRAFSILPTPINLPRDLLRGMASRHFVCLTIGSRGDVQYV